MRNICDIRLLHEKARTQLHIHSHHGSKLPHHKQRKKKKSPTLPSDRVKIILFHDLLILLSKFFYDAFLSKVIERHDIGPEKSESRWRWQVLQKLSISRGIRHRRPPERAGGHSSWHPPPPPGRGSGGHSSWHPPPPPETEGVRWTLILASATLAYSWHPPSPEESSTRL